MKIGSIDTGGKPGILDLLKAAPQRIEPAKAPEAADPAGRGERSGFRDALRGSSQDNAAAPKSRADDAEPIEPQADEGPDTSASQDKPESAESSAPDRDTKKAEQANEKGGNASEAEVTDEAEAEAGGEQLAKQAEANAQAEQAQQAYVGLGQIFGGVKAPQTEEEAQAYAGSEAEKAALAAMQKAYQEAIARRGESPVDNVVKNSFMFSVAPAAQGASADANADTANAESKATSQLATNSLAAQTTNAGTQAFAVPDQAAADVKPVLATSTQAQQADAVKQAQALPQINAGDNDAINTARLTRGLASAIQQRGGAVTLRLTPPEMGTVRIQMQITGTSLSASFHAESASAQTLLNTQLAQLRTALETQGMNVEKLSVQPMASASASSNANQSQNQNDGQQQSQAQQQSNHGEGRSRGQYSGDTNGQSERDADDPAQQRRERRGFFDRLSDAAQSDAA